MPTDPMARTAAFTDIDGLETYYETQGVGAPVVLLHGGMATNASWGAQFAGLAPTRQVIAPERQAHGHTPDRPGPLTYDAMTAHTVRLLETLGLGAADLVGWSDGGMIGFLIAARHPHLVRSLTLIGSGFASSGYVPGSIASLTALPADHDEMTTVAALYAEASPDGPAHFAAVWAKVAAMWDEPFDWSDELERITCPVLVLIGDDDCITVPHADELARRVRDGRLAVVPGASHVVPMEQPDLVNRLILEFLDRPAVQTMMPLRRRRPASD
jgi:pimeloyl-ACP methyl ester carboxylesterase